MVEPFLTISKVVVDDADHIVSVGQTLTYVLTVQHIPVLSDSTAYDFVLTDLVPAQLQNVVVTSMMGSGGVTGLTNLSLGNSIRIEADSIPVGGSITIVFTANVSLAAGSNTVIDNNARIYWDSAGDGDGNDMLEAREIPSRWTETMEHGRASSRIRIRATTISRRTPNES